jgi:hypothetical protein
MTIDYAALPVCCSEHTADGGRHGPVEADLLEIALGLRAMVTGRLPEGRPACPVVVTETLPRSTREDALRQEVEHYRSRGGRYSRWAERLAEAELGWFEDQSLRHEAEGQAHRAFLQVDEELDGDTRWQDQLAAAELLEWLRLEAGLTDRELEALQQAAAGTPVTDRHCLARARRRAQSALA